MAETIQVKWDEVRDDEYFLYIGEKGSNTWSLFERNDLERSWHPAAATRARILRAETELAGYLSRMAA